MRPLDDFVGGKEQRALQLARFRSHLKQVEGIHSALASTEAELQRLTLQKKSLAEDRLFFIAEAREQVMQLLKQGFTQAEIDANIDPAMAEFVNNADLTVLLPQRMRDEKS